MASTCVVCKGNMPDGATDRRRTCSGRCRQAKHRAALREFLSTSEGILARLAAQGDLDAADALRRLRAERV